MHIRPAHAGTLRGAQENILSRNANSTCDLLMRVPQVFVLFADNCGRQFLPECLKVSDQRSRAMEVLRPEFTTNCPEHAITCRSRQTPQISSQ